MAAQRMAGWGAPAGVTRTSTWFGRLVALGGVALGAGVVMAADGPPPDKSQYHLFNPTPRELMREMNTDRPDQTESPISMDAGHVQLEMDFFTFTRDRDRSGGGDVQTDIWEAAPLNLKVGLLNNVDLQLVIEPQHWVRAEDRRTHSIQEESGFGDVTTRVKVNFWGNDGGPTALGAIPFVRFLTSAPDWEDGGVEGGMLLPLGIELPWGWGTTVMGGFEVLRNESGRGNHANFIQSITFGHAIVGNLSGYAEFYSEVSAAEGEEWVGMADFGVTYGLTQDIQLDTGVNIGVTDAADDLNTFVGISVRF